MTRHEPVALQFGSVGQAYMWALEAAQRPGVRSPTQMAIESMKENPRRGTLTRDDITDTALSILMATNRIQPVTARMTFRSVFGEPDNLIDSIIAARVATSIQSGKPFAQVFRIAFLALVRLRFLEQRGERMPDAWYAHGLGIQRQSLASWRPIIEQAQAKLSEWLIQGKIKAREKLDRIGAMYGYDQAG